MFLLPNHSDYISVKCGMGVPTIFHHILQGSRVAYFQELSRFLLKEGTHEKYEFSLDRSQQSTKKVRNLKKKPHIRIISNAKITPVSNSIERPASPARKFAHFIYPLNCYVTSYLDLMGANKFLYYK